MTTPSLLHKAAFRLRVYYQKQSNQMEQSTNGLAAAVTKRKSMQSGLIQFRQVALVVMTTSALSFVMIMRSIWIGFAAVMVSVASASAANSLLEGIVNDANGHPIKGADIRIERSNTGRLLTTVKTDANGHYILQGLVPGNYRITLVVNGVVKTCINNTPLEPGESTQLNFDLTHRRASVTVEKGKHWVWMPAFPGSRLPGRWIEVDDSGSWAGVATANNIVRVSAEELQRTIHSVDIKRGQ